MPSDHPQFGPSRSVGIRAPGPIAQILSLLVFLALVAIGFVIFIPLALFAITVGLLFFIYIKVRVALTRARRPGGALDERRNVRVRERDE